MERTRHEGVCGHGMPHATCVDRNHRNPGGEAAHRLAKQSRIDRVTPAGKVKLLGSLAMMGEMIAQFPGIREVGDPPAVEIVFSHALLGESLEFFGIAGSRAPRTGSTV